MGGMDLIVTQAMHNAAEEIVIVTPYFVPNDSLLTAIRGAVLRGAVRHSCGATPRHPQSPASPVPALEPAHDERLSSLRPGQARLGRVARMRKKYFSRKSHRFL